MGYDEAVEAANTAVQCDTSGDHERALHYYKQAADELERVRELCQNPEEAERLRLAALDYRARATALTSRSSFHSKARSTVSSFTKTAKTGLKRFGDSVSKAANKVGSSTHVSTMAHGFSQSAGWGAGWQVGSAAGQAVVKSLKTLPSVPGKIFGSS
jgi:hypothetical protein